jgi:hypothetical protein
MLRGLYATGVLAACIVYRPVLSDEPPTKLVITEGRYIGYSHVADALATLESEGLTAVPGLNGGVSIVEPDGRTAWNFAGKDDPAYPSAVRYVYTRTSGELHAEITILCEASAGECEKFHSDIRDNLAQLAKRMAGDTSAKCSVSDNKLKCGGEPEKQ